MKTINKIVIASFMVMMLSVSCNEDKFLEEKPLSIYAAENSLVTNADYNAAIVHLYYRVRYMLFEQQADGRMAFWCATDLAFLSHDENKLNKYAAFMTPTYTQPVEIYNNLYVIVNQANLILTRLETSKLPDADKNVFRGEALFFRAFGYRILANLFGGVPLILTEVDKPRRDFVRATREETYTQAKNDLTEAVSLLANIDNVKDGRVSKQLAQHLLSEIYISLGDYDNAISAATAVIDYPGTGLMTSRFGSKINETPGDVCSDLHKTGNQNRSSGNIETLWASQFDYLNMGSSVSDGWMNYPNPFYSQITITADGVTTTAFKGNTAEKGGRSTGWMQSTDHFYYEIWEPGDLRNAPHIIVRDVQIDNEASPAFGKWFVADGYSVQADPYRQWYPFIGKITSDVPEDLYQRDADGNPLLTALGEHLILNAANSVFRDKYIFRLAETYLLRAEAYLGKNNKAAAATDINVVRARAQAPLANASEIDIDYILDERLRELYYEELRMCTLCRLGKLAERTRKYNSSYTAKGGRIIETTGTSIQDYHNLWPIPFAEIERNIYAVMEQNPGYTN